jgi:histone H1/5
MRGFFLSRINRSFAIFLVTFIDDDMASEASVAQVGTAAIDAKQQHKSPKKAKKTSSSPAKVGGAKKTNADHPKYSEMVHQALTNLKERGGSSRQAILKYIVKNFNVGKDENVVNTHLKMALKSGVKNASLKQSKGSGASASFRIGSEAKKPAKKVTSKKQPKSATKSAPKKKTPGAKKSVQKKSREAKKVSGAAKKPSTAVKNPKVAKTAGPSAAVKKTKVSAVKKTPKVKKPKTVAKKTSAAAKKA